MKKTKAKPKKKGEVKIKEIAVAIPKPKMEIAIFRIVGTTPYVQQKFSKKAQEAMKKGQLVGSQERRGKKNLPPKNFKALYNAAIRISSGGWCGMAAPGFRKALISACRVVGFTMTIAKLSIFIKEDGYDRDDGMPLVKITKGKPAYFETYARNANGAFDLRARPRWAEGWEAHLQVMYDADIFSLLDVTNLLSHAGLKVGVGEGRHDSKDSAGLGWGCFMICPE